MLDKQSTTELHSWPIHVLFCDPFNFSGVRGTGCFETGSHHVDHTGLVEIHLALPTKC